MSCCTARTVLILICVLQLLSTIQRQVFDFLGYMWTPIIGNFLQIIFVIVGLFGACQYRPKVVVVYALWCLLWLGWNIFVICFYLEVGVLHRDMPILNLGTGHKSWWLDNGIGCYVQPNATWTTVNPVATSRVVPPEELVRGCLLQYYYVETIQAGAQCLLALIGFCLSCIVIFVFTEEDDSYQYVGSNDAQPVSDVLEYIHMRYKSPARSSFRNPNRFYETMTMQSKQRAAEGQTTLSDIPSNPSDKYLAQKYLGKPGGKRGQAREGQPTANMPWVKVTPQTPQYPTTETMVEVSPYNTGQSQRTAQQFYNVMEQPPGATII